MRATFIRILLFYVLTILVIGLCINYADDTLLNAAYGGFPTAYLLIRGLHAPSRTVICRLRRRRVSSNCRLPARGLRRSGARRQRRPAHRRAQRHQQLFLRKLAHAALPRAQRPGSPRLRLGQFTRRARPCTYVSGLQGSSYRMC